MVFLGDQVYADDTSPAMKEFIESRRDPSEPPWDELKDYEEYAHLYRLAWSDPANRWLLSTLPSAMIFDDHDIRDDWNTSWTWRQQMEATDWWHERVVAGLGSYWVYQHLGNLGAQDRADDKLWRLVADHTGDDELDISVALDELADRADQEPTSYRWSFSRDFDDQARLVVVDSRAARVLEPDRRSMLDDEEMAWLDERMRGDVDHLLVGTSLPLLMAPKLHHVEAFGEALAQGAWGRLGGRVGEVLRQNADLEHWAAFQGGFVQVAQMVVDVASGLRGRTPRSITFLSGDVHHSYVAEAWADPALGVDPRQRGGAGDLLADPQPAARRHEGRHQGGLDGQGPTHRPPARRQGAALARALGDDERPLVRQQPRRRRAAGRPAALLVVARPCRRQGRRRGPARAGAGRHGGRPAPAGPQALTRAGRWSSG